MENNKEQNNPKMNMPKFNMNWIYIMAIIALVALWAMGGNESASIKTETSYHQFEVMLMKGYGSKVVVNNEQNTLQLYIKPEYIREVFEQSVEQTGKDPSLTVQFGSAEQVEQIVAEARQAGKFTGDLSYDNKKEGNIFTSLLLNLLPIIFLVFLWVFVMRRMSGGGGAGASGSVFNVGKSRAKMYEKGNEVNVTFKDVAGQVGAKQEVQEIVDFLRSPQKYTELGGKIPKGALLVGPPGTGKTLLAKAVAGEAGVPFFSMSGSDFVEMFVGVGASRVRDLFRQAKEKAPCIIFIDEIDAVGRARSKNPSMGGNDERENTLNALLTEMDGFGTNSGVIILAATNRADMLDSALLRAGRFDRQIYVDLPDLNERRDIFKVHTRPLKTNDTVDLDYLARQTPGFSGADIANVCNEAALIAARHNSKAVSKQDFISAIDRIIGGLEKKTKVMTDKEKRTIAIHEAGHATISWFTEFANPLVKVSIVPRGRALGAAWYMPEERAITTKEEMLDEMCATLGGRAAEELFTGHISTGAMNDLERVTKSAYGMIAYAGMSEKLPNVCYYNNNEYSFQRPYSETTAKVMDDEVMRIIDEQYNRAKQILTEHKDGHAQLAELLMSREVIFAEDVEKIFGKRPWSSRTEELLEAQRRAEAEAMAERRAEELAREAEAKRASEDDTTTREDEAGGDADKTDGNPEKNKEKRAGDVTPDDVDSRKDATNRKECVKDRKEDTKDTKKGVRGTKKDAKDKEEDVKDVKGAQ